VPPTSDLACRPSRFAKLPEPVLRYEAERRRDQPTIGTFVLFGQTGNVSVGRRYGFAVCCAASR